MSKLQKIDNQQNKYDEIIEYLNQDNGYWLGNDIWFMEETFYYKQGIKVGNAIQKTINFSNIKNTKMKNECKYYFLYNFKENLLSQKFVGKLATALNKHLSDFTNKFCKNKDSLSNLDKELFFNKWKLYLIDKGFRYY